MPTTLPSRRGVTLIELLIVILIMLLITAIVIPATAPALTGRRIREAARMLDVYVNGARNRALQTGRSYGVMIERTPVLNAGTGLATSSMGIALAYAEVPPPYTGDFTNSTIRVLGYGANMRGNGTFGAIDPNNPVFPNCDLSAPYFTQNDIGWSETVSPGDLLIIPPGPVTPSTAFRLYAGEPYIDVNNDGTWELGEPFLDCNLNNQCDTPNNGPFQATINKYVDPITGFFRVDPVSGASPGPTTSPPDVTITYMYADPSFAANTMTVTGQVPPAVGPIIPTGIPITFGPSASVDKTDPLSMPIPFATIPNSAQGHPFQIIRRPIKAAGTDQQLPDGTAIDLGGFDLNPAPSVGPPSYVDVVPGSGLDIFPFASFRPNPNYASNPANTPYAPDGSPVIITFAPNGIVDKVYSWDERNFTILNASIASGEPIGWQGRQPTTPIYLLVTRRELVGGDATVTTPSAKTPQYGIQDLTSLWVTINPQTGLVNTAQNGPINPILFSGPSAGNPFPYAIQCYEARQSARQTQNVGGR